MAGIRGQRDRLAAAAEPVDGGLARLLGRNAHSAAGPGTGWAEHAVLATNGTRVERAADRAGALLTPPAEADGPSLLHGDLWSGNVLFARGRARRPAGEAEPVLIDPAVYVGHREVDLAMTRLFGGFPRAFHRGYDETWPLQPGHERRRPAYELYPLLVHARLFGGGYVGAAVRAAEAVLTGGR